VFCSGQIALKPGSGDLLQQGIVEQTKQVMENLKGVLGEAGLGLENVVKITVFLVNMEDFAVMNEVYGSYFTADPPARAVIQVGRLPKDARVEIEAIACY